jgi:hypothetical protein
VLGIPGTYAAPSFPGIYANADASLQASGTILIQGAGIAGGNTDPTTQGQYIIAGTGIAQAVGIVNFSFGTQAILRGLKIQNDATGGQHSLAATTGSSVYCEYVTFGGAGLSSGGHIYAGDEAVIKTGPGIVIASSAGAALWALGAGITTKSGPNITVQGTLNITTFAKTENGGRILTPGAAGYTVTGSVTGTRYSAVTNGIINTSGAGANYFPGTVAGSTATGGQYA